jgi:hypothetical protein
MLILTVMDIAVLGLFVTGGGVAFAGLSYWYGLSEAKRERTVDRVMRYSEPTLLRLTITADDFLRREPTSAAECEAKWRMFEGDPELRHAVLATLNYYEEIGALHNLRFLNKRLTLRLLWPTIDDEYRRAEWFIKMRRREDSPDCFTEWQRMVESLRPPELANH